MLSFIDKIKSLFENANINIKILNFENSNFSIVNQTGNSKKIIQQDNKLMFNYPQFDDSEKNILKEGLKESFNNSEIDLLEDNSNDTINDFESKASKRSNKTILEFYKDKILDKHLRALEASLYLKEVFESGSDISKLKKQIISKFGDDGRNICNLCSAGYFEGYIKEVYNDFAFSNDFVPKKFMDYFDIILKTSPFAIFVSREMTEIELSGLINHKLDTHKKYGIKFLAVHGIGANNVKKIRKIIDSLSVDKQLNVSIFQEGNNIVTIKINLIS